MKTGSIRIAALAAAALALAGCRTTGEAQGSLVKEGGGRPVGEFIGGPAIQQVLWENVLDQSAPGSKTFRISRVLGLGMYGQRGLLGGNGDDGDRFEFRGGVPNPLGVLLWYKTMRTLAASFGALCAQPPEARTLAFSNSETDKPVLADNVHQLVRKLCEAPATTADLEAMWRIVVGFGLDDEKAAFLARFNGEAGGYTDGAARVEGVMVALLMNPSLLLQQ